MNCDGFLLSSISISCKFLLAVQTQESRFYFFSSHSQLGLFLPVHQRLCVAVTVVVNEIHWILRITHKQKLILKSWSLSRTFDDSNPQLIYFSFETYGFSYYSEVFLSEMSIVIQNQTKSFEICFIKYKKFKFSILWSAYSTLSTCSIEH